MPRDFMKSLKNQAIHEKPRESVKCQGFHEILKQLLPNNLT